MSKNKQQSPDEILLLGEKIYFDKKESLERKNYGDFAVIDVESREIFVDPDKLSAIQKAQKKYPDKLFYIVQIGNLKRVTPEIDEVRKYGWAF